MIFKKRLIDQRVIKMAMRINCDKYKIQKTLSPVTYWTFRSTDISPRAEHIHKLTSYVMHMCHNVQYKSHFPMKTVSDTVRQLMVTTK